jgi:tetratricopeptide (TPR) repeat protein
MPETEKDITKAWLPLQCPKCGGELGKLPDGLFKCAYCGTSFLPGEVFAAKPIDLRELYERAFAALDEGEYDRAYEYFKRILEQDATEYQAWVGKGIAGAYNQLATTGRLETGEVLSCMEVGLERYGGDDKVSFRCEIADRVGVLAVDLIHYVKSKGIYDKTTLHALFDLLSYWETEGTEELACWTATVAVAEMPVVTAKSKNIDGTTYSESYYLFENVAHEYSEKIRIEYDPAFTNAFERRAADRDRWNEAFFSVAKTVLIVLAAFTVGGALIVVCVIVLIFLAALLSASVS